MIHGDFKNTINFVSSVKPNDAPIKIKNAIPMVKMLEENKAVKAVTSQYTAKVFYLAGSTQLNGLIKGVEIDKEVQIYNLDNYISSGNYKDLKSGTNNIILGKGIAKKLSLELYDKITVNAGNGNVSLKIVGFYESGMSDIDNIQSYTSIETAQRVGGVTNNYITDINIKLHNKELAAGMANRLETQFGISAVDINEANAQFDTGTSIRNLISYAVSITLLVVAGFGIYNILNMFIYEKMDDIAIWDRALTPDEILKIYKGENF
jgi:lipoprotein-releasing system permease protein